MEKKSNEKLPAMLKLIFGNITGKFFKIGDKSGIKKLISDKLYLKLHYFKNYGKNLDLENPLTFNEKLQWLKLYDRNPLYSTLVDKYEVRKYVAEKIGDKYLIPCYGVWDNFEDIDFSSLPDQFVLKCTHDSGSIVFCKDKLNFDIKEAKRVLEKALSRNYFWNGREWPYKNVKPRIIAEKLMTNYSDNDLTDYKFFCFDGDPKYCQVISNRRIHETIDFYDKEWKHQDFIGLTRNVSHAEKSHSKPRNFELMLIQASILSDEIPFVRVDFYEIEGNLYFGEMTFFPAGASGIFSPDEWNYKFGDLITLPKKRKN